jgi:two-component sensor histidine kinase/putative methionine-R-sulfoxide reductase with GAF domain
MPNGRYTVALAIAGTLLTSVGFLASPTGGHEWQVLSNRALALFVIWFSASLVHYRRQMEENQNRLVKEFAVTTEIARVFNSSLNINELYDPISAAIRQLISFDRIHLSLVDYDSSTITPVWRTSPGLPGRPIENKIPLEGSLAGEVVRTRLPTVLEAVNATSLERQYPLVMGSFNTGLRSFIAIPLIDRDLVIGVLQIGSEVIGAYSQNDLGLADRIASQIAGAIANSQLSAEHKRLAEENFSMAEIGRIISSSPEIGEVYDALGEEIQKMIPCDRISLNLIDLERRIRSTIWVSGDVVRGGDEGDELPLERSIAAEAVRTRLPIMLDTESDSDLLLRYPLLSSSIDAGFRLFLSVPLISRDTVIGVLRVQSKSLRAYSQQHCDIFEKIGNQISGAVASSRIYTKQLISEERIKASLEEKEVLLREINHRVKNNLQIISSLLNLQSRDIQDEKALRGVQASQDRIQSMAMVHEKLYQSEDLARIDFGEYIRSLATDLGSSYGLGSRGINLEIDVEDIRLSVDTAIPCGVIVNELVTNSLKHAFPRERSGQIYVKFQEADGRYNMVFKDDGIGLPENLDINQPSSLGLTIVNALVGQLQGTFNYCHNGGCEVSITFPAEGLNRGGVDEV